MSAAISSRNAPAPSLLNGLLAWWGCHELAGSARADKSGNNVVLSETLDLVASAPGLIGQAASLTATSYLGLESRLLASGPFSFACWVNPTDASAAYVLMSQGAATAILLQINFSGNYAFTIRTGQGVTGPIATLEAWSHVVVTYDGTTCRMFINGVLQAIAIKLTPTYTATAFALGALASAGSTILNGMMQLAGVWARTLTDGGVTVVGSTALGEVAALYNNGRGLDYPFNVAA